MENRIVSVIMPTYKRLHILDFVLQSYLDNVKTDLEWELVLLNEAEENENLNSLIKKYKILGIPINYIHSGKTKQNIENWRVPGFSLNIGVKKAKGNILILTSADVYQVDNCLDDISKKVEDKKIIIPQGKDDLGDFLLSLPFKKEQDKYEVYNNITRRLNTNLPFYMGVTKQDFFEIGGYDENMSGHSFEDNDFVRRLLWNNCQIIQTENKVVHLYHERPKNIKQTQQYLYNQNIYKTKTIKDVIANKNKNWGFYE